jgi:uncharacterized membrane protein HdeD (DUF308 family)
MMNYGPTGWLKEAKKNAGLLIALGVIEVIAGFLALGSPLIAGLAVTVLVGIALIVAGVTRLIGAFKAGSFGAGALAFLSGALAVIVGGYMLARPGIGLTSLTLVLAIYLFVDGVTRLGIGFKMKPVKGWGTTVFSGIAGIALGFLIWRQWPLSAAWAVGTLTGIHLIFAGWSMVGIGAAARKGTSEVQEAVDSAAAT